MAASFSIHHARASQSQAQRSVKSEGLFRKIGKTVSQMLGFEPGPMKVASANRNGAYYLNKPDLRVVSERKLAKMVHGRTAVPGNLPPDHQLNDFLTGIVDGRILVN